MLHASEHTNTAEERYCAGTLYTAEWHRTQEQGRVVVLVHRDTEELAGGMLLA